MSLNIASMHTQMGTWTNEETCEVAHLILSELSDTDVAEVVSRVAGGDEAMTEEIISTLENQR